VKNVREKRSDVPVFSHYHIRRVVKENVKKQGTRELGVLWCRTNNRDIFSSTNRGQNAKFSVTTEARSDSLKDGCDLECDDRCHKFLDLLPSST